MILLLTNYNKNNDVTPCNAFLGSMYRFWFNKNNDVRGVTGVTGTFKTNYIKKYFFEVQRENANVTVTPVTWLFLKSLQGSPTRYIPVTCNAFLTFEKKIVDLLPKIMGRGERFCRFLVNS